MHSKIYQVVNERRLSADAHVNMGKVYIKQGLYGKAESQFYEALDINPDLPHAYYNLVVLYNEEGDKREQRDYLKQLLVLTKTLVKQDGPLENFKAQN